MNRRGFLSLFGLGAVGLMLDPERLLWVPGQKTIFLPSIAPPCPNMGLIVAQAWEAYITRTPQDDAFARYFLLNSLKEAA